MRTHKAHNKVHFDIFIVTNMILERQNIKIFSGKFVVPVVVATGQTQRKFVNLLKVNSIDKTLFIIKGVFFLNFIWRVGWLMMVFFMCEH